MIRLSLILIQNQYKLTSKLNVYNNKIKIKYNSFEKLYHLIGLYINITHHRFQLVCCFNVQHNNVYKSNLEQF